MTAATANDKDDAAAETATGAEAAAGEQQLHRRWKSYQKSLRKLRSADYDAGRGSGASALAYVGYRGCFPADSQAPMAS